MISDGACRHAASARSSGFVLVGVVWFLAIMTLLASAAVLWVGRSLDATENRRKALLRELEEHALLARVQWLVATQRYTVAGLSVPGNAGAAPSKVDMDTSILPIGGELPLDGREFCMANGWCIALLDRSARLSLSGIDPRVLSRLLAGLGVPAEQVQVMVAQWFSYLYPGAAPRLGSAAQASDRSSPGQARRRPLRSVMEVFRLEAWLTERVRLAGVPDAEVSVLLPRGFEKQGTIARIEAQVRGQLQPASFSRLLQDIEAEQRQVSVEFLELNNMLSPMLNLQLSFLFVAAY